QRDGSREKFATSKHRFLLVVFCFFERRACLNRSAAKSSANSSFQIGARDPIVAQCVDVAPLRRKLILFCQKKIVRSFYHRVVMSEGDLENFLSPWQTLIPVVSRQ